MQALERNSWEVVFVQEITVITENKVGVLADICGLLGRSGVNIEAISAQGLGESGIIRLVTGDVKTAVRELERAGAKIRVAEILTVKLNDQPGELGKIARKLARAGVDIESLYLLSKNRGVMEVAIKPGDLNAARLALK